MVALPHVEIHKTLEMGRLGWVGWKLAASIVYLLAVAMLAKACIDSDHAGLRKRAKMQCLKENESASMYL